MNGLKNWVSALPTTIAVAIDAAGGVVLWPQARMMMVAATAGSYGGAAHSGDLVALGHCRDGAGNDGDLFLATVRGGLTTVGFGIFFFTPTKPNRWPSKIAGSLRFEAMKWRHNAPQHVGYMRLECWMPISLSPSIQFGLDLATSLAILGSALMFMWNQKRKNDQQKIQRMDASVRNVATEHIQKALHTLSRQFISGVVNTLNTPSIVCKGTLDDIEKRFSLQEGLASKMLDRFSEASDQLSSFSDEIEAYKYQIYPLLDTLGDGQREISLFKCQLSELISQFNTINRGALPLARQLERVLAFCTRHPMADGLNEEDTNKLLELAAQVMFDPDYAYWVNTFIADEDEKTYWDDTSPQRQKVRQAALNNFIAHAYEKPNRLRAQVFNHAYELYQDGRIMCKKFLIMLAAVNNTLLLGEGSKDAQQGPSAIAKRYASDDYFELGRTVR